MNTPTLDILLIDSHEDQARAALEAWQTGPDPLSLRHFSRGQDSLFYLRFDPSRDDNPMPKLIFFDWDLPHGNGLEVLAEIKSHERLRCIPLVLWTASDKPGDILKAYQHFANTYLVKPPDTRDYPPVLRETASFWLNIAQLPSL